MNVYNCEAKYKIPCIEGGVKRQSVVMYCDDYTGKIWEVIYCTEIKLHIRVIMVHMKSNEEQQWSLHKSPMVHLNCEEHAS